MEILSLLLQELVSQEKQSLHRRATAPPKILKKEKERLQLEIKT